MKKMETIMQSDQAMRSLIEGAVEKLFGEQWTQKAIGARYSAAINGRRYTCSSAEAMSAVAEFIRQEIDCAIADSERFPCPSESANHLVGVTRLVLSVVTRDLNVLHKDLSKGFAFKGDIASEEAEEETSGN